LYFEGCGSCVWRYYKKENISAVTTNVVPKFSIESVSHITDRITNTNEPRYQKPPFITRHYSVAGTRKVLTRNARIDGETLDKSPSKLHTHEIFQYSCFSSVSAYPRVRIRLLDFLHLLCHASGGHTAKRGQQTFLKRQKENLRKEVAAEKMARRQGKDRKDTNTQRDEIVTFPDLVDNKRTSE